jgi:hypothetical protein
MSAKTPTPYENNPFMIGIEGLKLTFTQAKSVGIYAIVLTSAIFIVSMITSVVSTVMDAGGDNQTEGQVQISSMSEVIVILLVALVGILIYLIVSLLFYGVLEQTAAVIAKGGTTTLRESFKVVLKGFPAYLWLYILLIVKVLLWSLLFLIPGVIMMNRYLLSGTVFFAEGKRGNAAIQRSSELVKGAWITTYGGAWAWNLVSQGLATLVFWPGCVAILYRQLSQRTDSGEAKPPAHVLSWLLLCIPIGLAVLLIVGILLLTVLMAVASTR